MRGEGGGWADDWQQEGRSEALINIKTPPNKTFFPPPFTRKSSLASLFLQIASPFDKFISRDSDKEVFRRRFSFRHRHNTKKAIPTPAWLPFQLECTFCSKPKAPLMLALSPALHMSNIQLLLVVMAVSMP